MWYLVFYCAFQTLVTCFHVPYSALTMFISREQSERDSATAYRKNSLSPVCSNKSRIIPAPCVPTNPDIRPFLNPSSPPVCSQKSRNWGRTSLCGDSSGVRALGRKRCPHTGASTGDMWELALGWGPPCPGAVPGWDLCLWGLSGWEKGFSRREEPKCDPSLPQLSATLTIPFWQWFLTQFGKKKAVYVGISSAIPFLIAVVVLDSNLIVTYVVAVAAGISVAAAFLLPWSMLPDVIDDFKLQHPSSHGHEAIFFSFYVFFTKFTAGVSLGISTLSLDFAGYRTRGCSQPGQVNFTLKMLVSAVPVGLILLSLLLFKLYPIDEEKRRKNKKALQDLR
uniref:Major facilitator superfamily domain containing 2B n=1 Tax=Malurus cyaneus samueli TaxID=2593467 RepID=A0A8C5T2E8_9PASS